MVFGGVFVSILVGSWVPVAAFGSELGDSGNPSSPQRLISFASERRQTLEQLETVRAMPSAAGALEFLGRLASTPSPWVCKSGEAPRNLHVEASVLLRSRKKETPDIFSATFEKVADSDWARLNLANSLNIQDLDTFAYNHPSTVRGKEALERLVAIYFDTHWELAVLYALVLTREWDVRELQMGTLLRAGTVFEYALVPPIEGLARGFPLQGELPTLIQSFSSELERRVALLKPVEQQAIRAKREVALLAAENRKSQIDWRTAVRQRILSPDPRIREPLRLALRFGVPASPSAEFANPKFPLGNSGVSVAVNQRPGTDNSYRGWVSCFSVDPSHEVYGTAGDAKQRDENMAASIALLSYVTDVKELGPPLDLVLSSMSKTPEESRIPRVSPSEEVRAFVSRFADEISANGIGICGVRSISTKAFLYEGLAKTRRLTRQERYEIQSLFLPIVMYSGPSSAETFWAEETVRNSGLQLLVTSGPLLEPWGGLLLEELRTKPKAPLFLRQELSLGYLLGPSRAKQILEEVDLGILPLPVAALRSVSQVLQGDEALSIFLRGIRSRHQDWADTSADQLARLADPRSLELLVSSLADETLRSPSFPLLVGVAITSLEQRREEAVRQLAALLKSESSEATLNVVLGILYRLGEIQLSDSQIRMVAERLPNTTPLGHLLKPGFKSLSKETFSVWENQLANSSRYQKMRAAQWMGSFADSRDWIVPKIVKAIREERDSSLHASYWNALRDLGANQDLRVKALCREVLLQGSYQDFAVAGPVCPFGAYARSSLEDTILLTQRMEHLVENAEEERQKNGHEWQSTLLLLQQALSHGVPNPRSVELIQRLIQFRQWNLGIQPFKIMATWGERSGAVFEISMSYLRHPDAGIRRYMFNALLQHSLGGPKYSQFQSQQLAQMYLDRFRSPAEAPRVRLACLSAAARLVPVSAQYAAYAFEIGRQTEANAAPVDEGEIWQEVFRLDFSEEEFRDALTRFESSGVAFHFLAVDILRNLQKFPALFDEVIPRYLETKFAVYVLSAMNQLQARLPLHLERETYRRLLDSEEPIIPTPTNPEMRAEVSREVFLNWTRSALGKSRFERMAGLPQQLPPDREVLELVTLMILQCEPQDVGRAANLLDAIWKNHGEETARFLMKLPKEERTNIINRLGVVIHLRPLYHALLELESARDKSTSTGA